MSEQSTIEVPVLRNNESTLKERMTENAYDSILPARYLKKNEDGEVIEEQEELFIRVAKNIAIPEALHHENAPKVLGIEHTHEHFDIEEFEEYLTEDGYLEFREETARYISYDNVFDHLNHQYPKVADVMKQRKEEFQNLMEHLNLMPNTPCLINAGRDLQQLSACFVLDIDDDMRDIHEVAADAAEIFQSGGGLGYPFSFLRPYGDKVGSTGGVASGPISFMNTLDQVCNTVAQGGCVAGDTRVMTDKGYKRISDIHNDTPLNPNGKPLDVSVQTRSGDYHQVKETSDSGIMEVFEIETEGGYTVRGSSDHPVLVMRGGELEYVEIEDICGDDVMVMDQSTSLPEVYAILEDIEERHFNESSVSLPEIFDEDVAFFLGVLWGDGTFDNGNNRVVFSVGKSEREEPIKRRLESILKSWNVNYTERDQNGTGKGDYWRIECHSSALVDWMEKNELEKNINHIPEKLHHSPATIPDFIAGMVCDATYASDGGVVRFSTISEIFAKNLQDLLMLCGVPSKIYSDDKRQGAYGDNEIFMVETRAGPSTETFDKVIPHPFNGNLSRGGERQNQVPEADEIVDDILSDNFEKNCKLSEGVDKKSMKELRRYERGERTPSRKRLVSLLEDVGVDVPEELSDKFWFESVNRVESAGYEYVYDIEMLHDAHEFVGDNFCVHNVRRGAQMGVMNISHPDIPFFIHAKNTDVSLAQTLLLNDPDDFTHDSFGEALEEAQGLIDEEGRVPEHLRNAAEGHLSNFNISVGVTDDFMDALQNGEDYTLINPRTEQPHIASEETKDLYSWFDMGEYVEVGEELSVPAQEIWDRIIDGAHSNGEPGVIYIDRVNEHNTFDHEEYPEYCINATNPCFAGDTRVYTEDGLVKFEELYEEQKDVTIDSEFGEGNQGRTLRVYKNGEKEVYELKTSHGHSVKATEDHKIRVQDGWSTVSELEEGDIIRIFEGQGGFGEKGSIEEGRTMGWFAGDGHYSHGRDERAVLNFYDQDVELVEKFEGYVNNLVPEAQNDMEYPISSVDVNEPERRDGERKTISSSRLFDYFKRYIGESKTDIPESVFRGSEEMVRGYLQGIFSADGSVQSYDGVRNSIRLTSVDEKNLQGVQKLLLQFGIKSKIYNGRKKSGEKAMPDGKGGEKTYQTQELHELCITIEGMQIFAKEIGFLLEEKQGDVEEMLSEYTKGPYSQSFYSEVESIEPAGVETVYDLTETKTHSYVAEGITVSNCGEEPLFDGDACNLTHINLSTIVDENAVVWNEIENEVAEKDGFIPREKTVKQFLNQVIDWDEFNHRIDTGVNFLDNVVTMSDFPIDNIDETVQSSRKIGLGIMGLAQLFIQLGVEYGSEESQEIARQLMKHIHHRSKEKSRQLAEERGSFDDWDKSKWSKPQSHPDFFEHHTGLNPQKCSDGYPQRNHETTTIAPTGTTSQIGDTSGGCEPIFSVCYYKNVTDDIQGDEMLVEFDSLFLKTLEENGVDVEKAKREAVELMEKNEFDGPSSIPSVPEEIGELFVTTNQLSAKEHASVQCALQEGVGSGISKTVNAPNDSTLDDAKDAFEYIYKNGGKSVTYYRDGSRTKQVQTTRKDNQETSNEDASEKEREVPFHREAPDVLDDVERHRIRTGSGKLYVTIGEDEHGVVEVMATVGKSGGQVESFTEALARQISQSLQWGVPVEEVIEQLQNIKGPDIGYDGQDIVHSVPDGISLALKRYTEDKEMLNHPTTKVDVSADEEQTTNASECPECGAMALIDQEGCNTCLPEMGGCGWSKC